MSDDATFDGLSDEDKARLARAFNKMQEEQKEAVTSSAESFTRFLVAVGLPWLADKIKRLWNGAMDVIAKILDMIF